MQMTTRVRRLPGSIPTAYIGLTDAMGLLFLHRDAVIQPQVKYSRLRRALDDLRIVLHEMLVAARVIAVAQQQRDRAPFRLNDDADIFWVAGVHLGHVLHE